MRNLVVVERSWVGGSLASHDPDGGLDPAARVPAPEPRSTQRRRCAGTAESVESPSVVSSPRPSVRPRNEVFRLNASSAARTDSGKTNSWDGESGAPRPRRQRGNPA